MVLRPAASIFPKISGLAFGARLPSALLSCQTAEIDQRIEDEEKDQCGGDEGRFRHIHIQSIQLGRCHCKMAVGAPADRMTQVIMAGSDTKRTVRP